MNTEHSLKIFAAAKINLYLHILRRHANGYHDLDSLLAFASIGDTITITPSDHFDFKIDGTFAAHFNAAEKSPLTDSKNLVVRAAHLLAGAAQRKCNAAITLTKDLPLAAGLGGGSSDAAATIWGLLRHWNIPANEPFIQPILKMLGADVPACFYALPCRILGIGDEFEPIRLPHEFPAIFINPLKPCPTTEVFLNHNGALRTEISYPSNNMSADAFIDFLKAQDNVLSPAAIEIVPEIQNILTSLSLSQGCRLARMSGSGATCFGIFDSVDCAKTAQQTINTQNPDWWVTQGWINHAARY